MMQQFGSLEEFQEEFRDINQEEQVGRLHKMLAPHLLRSKLLGEGEKKEENKIIIWRRWRSSFFLSLLLWKLLFSL